MSERRKLLDVLAGTEAQGPPRAILGTSFDLQPDFVDTDFLPTLLGVSAWDDRLSRSRVQLDRALADADGVVLMMDGRRFQGRPRSLQVDLTPALSSRVLHAKVTVVVYDAGVSLLVTSANLTSSGYRDNREVAVKLIADAKSPEVAGLIRDALSDMPTVLEPWWTDPAARVHRRAVELLESWATHGASRDERFVWGGGAKPLWQSVLDAWPRGELVEHIDIVSPFWSEDEPDGPLSMLVGELRERGALRSRSTVRLLAPSAPDHPGLPALPGAYATFDFRTLGIDATAVAVRAQVDPEDLDRGDVLRDRRLHAKVLLMRGATSTLAYLGSANFTRSGWGFRAQLQNNIEAGLVLVRRGAGRAALERLIPPTEGDGVRLDGRAGPMILAPAADPDPTQPWPSFLRRVELRRHTDARGLILHAELWEGPVPRWSIALVEAGRRLLGQGEETAVVLLEDELFALYRQPLVYVSWDDSIAPFPVNVSAEVRCQVPLADGASLASEAAMLAFFLGRLAFEDAWPAPHDEEAPGEAASVVTAEPCVDTSEIVSYQIRLFVEALPGIRQSLRSCRATEMAIRQALLGPISLVALARTIVEAVHEGRRSATAGGFQLVELLACLEEVANDEVEARLAEAWTRACADARAELVMHLHAIREGDGALAPATPFDRYAVTVLGGAS